MSPNWSNPRQQIIKALERKIDATSSVYHKIQYTYVASKLKDASIVPPNPHHCLYAQCEVGDILLINKGKPHNYESKSRFEKIEYQIATLGLQLATQEVRVHTVMVADIIDGIPHIIHSIISDDEGRSGVVQQALDQYIQSYQSMDILVLKPNDTYRLQTVQSIRDKLGQQYDKKAAISQLFPDIIDDDPHKVNCVEIIAENFAKAWIGYRDLADKKLPSDFLFHDYIKPRYITTVKTL